MNMNHIKGPTLLYSKNIFYLTSVNRANLITNSYHRHLVITSYRLARTIDPQREEKQNQRFLRCLSIPLIGVKKRKKWENRKGERGRGKSNPTRRSTVFCIFR